MVKTNVIPHASSNALASASSDIHGIKAPVPIPDVWFWIWCAAGVCALALLAWWLWRRKRKPQAAPPAEPPIPAHEKARARLLESLSLLHQPRPFCILVSDTIRVYLEERFDLHAPERTTEEFLEELQTSPFLVLEQKQALGEFLARCDLVKFARYEPGEPELRGIYESALRLVEETQPPPAISNEATAAAPQAS
jgi:hypothetical protein